MRSPIPLAFFLVGALSQAPLLSDPTRKYVLDVVERALKEEDPVVRQALVASIGFPYIPTQNRGWKGYGRVIIFTSIMLLIVNLFCLYVLLLWIKYVFQKRGIYQRYLRWSAARDRRKQQEDILFEQADKECKRT
ncbi:uncharacterized protein N0V89_009611 [Didymosphaeria variabile]|uniref:Uncharacterized protein n=1 Tax=Didymosphaeria variabile TaxID=1932322 RepID=A0A9W9C8B5_9PLEO|nr:uncharacterized protein N0V89_009611 [Didymosphaeria variabile]KAJ4348239.1 hypothetical protein N0V89_009611 [Didymosphaeria variabile]